MFNISKEIKYFGAVNNTNQPSNNTIEPSKENILNHPDVELTDSWMSSDIIKNWGIPDVELAKSWVESDSVAKNEFRKQALLSLSLETINKFKIERQNKIRQGIRAVMLITLPKTTKGQVSLKRFEALMEKYLPKNWYDTNREDKLQPRWIMIERCDFNLIKLGFENVNKCFDEITLENDEVPET